MTPAQREEDRGVSSGLIRIVRRSDILASAVALGSVAGLALFHLPHPFSKDQAFSLAGAVAVDHGQTLYVDFWDIRQPGMIFFSWLAGRLFGFTEVGLHSLEFVWMMLAAGVLWAVARRMISRAWLAAWAPLLTVGVYYCQATDWEMTQPEALIVLPLAVCLLCAVIAAKPSQKSSLTFFAFGLAAGVLACFKLGLLVIPLTMVLVCLTVLVFHEKQPPGKVILTAVPAMAAGFCLVLLPVLFYFWRHDALRALWWTTFVCPQIAFAEIPHAPYRRLLDAVRWFVTPWLLGLPLFVVALWPAKAFDRQVHAWLLCGWIAAGLSAIVMQRFTWLSYYFVMLIAPTGLLALRGIDAALNLVHWPTRRESFNAALITAPLALTLVWPMGAKLAAAGRAWHTPSYTTSYQAEIVPQYPEIVRSARTARDRPAGEKIFVFGDPRLLLFSGRLQAIPMRGFTLWALFQQQFDAYPEMLVKAAPPLIYMDTYSEGILRRRSPRVLELLRSDFRSLTTDTLGGTWYERAPRQAQAAGQAVEAGR